MSPKADPSRSQTNLRSQSSAKSSSSSSSQPYPNSTPRRSSSSQPKSTRQQFSACGACRMRRVRCDLKDLQSSDPAANHTACSNCQERGLKCVDEFAEVKAVKLLRRGRRLAQVEAVYGKAATQQAERIAGSSTGAHSIIPRLRSEFFNSPFFRTFLLQRPIIDPLEFASRFAEDLKGDPDALGATGHLLCLVLATWAASFGVNELGQQLEPDLHHHQHQHHRDAQQGGTHAHHRGQAARRRKERTNEMVRELLHLIDLHGVLRKPSWDGVRVLLLIVPLSEDVQAPMDRLAMYESTINQVYTLCSLVNTASINSGQGEFVDATVRARIFWYAYIHEGMTTGLRGGRLILTDEDLSAFESTLPLVGAQQQQQQQGGAVSRSVSSYQVACRFSKTPVRLSRTCRLVHSTLTGPRARRFDEINEPLLREAWDALASSWEDLEDLRHIGTAGVLQPDDVERFVHGWQILIFECYNVIREALKQRIIECSGAGNSHGSTTSSSGHGVATAVANASVSMSYLPDGRMTRNSSHAASARLAQSMRLHAIADAKCRDFARFVVNIIRQHLGGPMFEHDASLVRDGCFFAGILLAGDNANGVSSSGGSLNGTSNGGSNDEDVRVCLEALREMRWAFAKSEEREDTINLVWRTRAAASGGGGTATGAGTDVPPHQDPSTMVVAAGFGVVSPYHSRPHSSANSSGSNTPPNHHSHQQHQQQQQMQLQHQHQQRMRQAPPPLSMSHHPGVDLADPSPNTAATEDGPWTAFSQHQQHQHPHQRSPPSLSGSPPYLTASSAPGAHQVAGPGIHHLNTKVPTMPVYFPVASADPATDPHFAFSVASMAGQGSDSGGAHDLTPPRSSAGMSAASTATTATTTSSSSNTMSYQSDAGAAGFYAFQSPPGTGSGGTATDLSDENLAYHHAAAAAAGYGGGPFYVG